MTNSAASRKSLTVLLEVDDVDAVPLAEDVRLHLRIPALGLVSEVDAGLQQILHRDRAQAASVTSDWRDRQSPLLALAELEALARASHAVLLAFLGARVARQQARPSCSRARSSASNSHERARDAEAQRAGLAGYAAAGDRREHVELLGVLGEQRAAGWITRPQRLGREVLFERAVR